MQIFMKAIVVCTFVKHTHNYSILSQMTLQIAWKVDINYKCRSCLQNLWSFFVVFVVFIVKFSLLLDPPRLLRGRRFSHTDRGHDKIVWRFFVLGKRLKPSRQYDYAVVLFDGFCCCCCLSLARTYARARLCVCLNLGNYLLPHTLITPVTLVFCFQAATSSSI